MRNLTFKLVPTAILAFALIFSGCEDKFDPDAQTVKDQAKAAYIVSDAFAVANDHSGSKKSTSEYPACLTPEWNATNDTLTLTFDNCSYNGHTRNGQIVAAFSSSWAPGEVMSLEFENYSVDGDVVDGNIEVTFNSANDEAHTFSVVVTDMSITFSKGGNMSWSSDFNVNMTGGFTSSLNPADNVFELNGSGSGINQDGEAYTSQYNSVIIKGTCEWPVAGTLTITKEGASVIEVDFDSSGEQECTGKITVTQNGISISVNL